MQVQGTFFQNLIICFYEHDAIANDGLCRRYHHFLGRTSSTKNDVGFVIGVWKQMINQDFFRGVDRIWIFSDGGPKHFKLTSCMTFFRSAQKHLKIPITYNFFASHHGHSICDGVAAQAKKACNQIQRINQKPITIAQQIVDTVSVLTNHCGQIAETVDIEKDAFETFLGIRKLHKFTFSNDKIIGYVLSSDQNAFKEYNVPQVGFFL